MKHLKYKLLGIPLGLLPLVLLVGAWILAQETCCAWGEMLWTAFEVLPVAVSGAAIAYIVSLLLQRQRIDQ